MTGSMLRIDGDGSHPTFWMAGAVEDPRAPVLVCVHGISRNAEEQARTFHGSARRAGWVVVAPLFDEGAFPDYQRLGRRGRRADLALLAVLAEVEARRGHPAGRVALFGFSGGAQFAHRFALAWPEVVGDLFLAAAGWYTMPDPRRRFPYGLAWSRRLPDLLFHLGAFLRRRIRVFVGEEDVVCDEAVRRHPRIDPVQGHDRLERARRWCAALAATARAQGLPCDVRFDVLPGVGHDFAACADPAGGDLVGRILAELDHARKETAACAA